MTWHEFCNLNLSAYNESCVFNYLYNFFFSVWCRTQALTFKRFCVAEEMAFKLPPFCVIMAVCVILLRVILKCSFKIT